MNYFYACDGYSMVAEAIVELVDSISRGGPACNTKRTKISPETFLNYKTVIFLFFY